LTRFVALTKSVTENIRGVNWKTAESCTKGAIELHAVQWNVFENHYSASNTMPCQRRRQSLSDN